MIPTMTPSVWLAVALAALLALGGATAYGYQWGEEAATNRIAADDARLRDLADDIEQRVAQRIAAIKVQNTVVRQEVERELVEVPVYRECKHAPDVLRLINHALTGTPVPAGAGDVPEPGPADRAGLR